jgi:hypothetical protein
MPFEGIEQVMIIAVSSWKSVEEEQRIRESE